MQSIQEISLNIQKILLRRIDIVSSAYLSLNDKVNTEIFWTRDIVKKLLRKLKNVSIKEELTRWQVNVQNLRMENGSRYAEASDGVKILLVVSDIFRIVRSQTDLIDEPFLETALNDHLGIPDQIRISDFYRDIISERCCLPLYVKEEYNYLAGNISEYGRSIYHINDFYLDYHIKEIAQQNGRTLQDMCLETYGGTTHEKDKTVRVSDLCQRLLADLSDLDDRHQAEMKETILQESTVKPTPQELPKETITYSVLRLTPEGRRLFKNGGSSIEEFTSKKGRFQNVQSMKAEIDKIKPFLITAPEKCIKDYGNIFPEGTKCVSLSDYYMFLWFENKEKSERANKMVAFIDHYDKRLYYSRYIVVDSGDGYERINSEKNDMHDKRTGNHTIKDVVKELTDSYGNKKDIEIYMTFLDDTINKRLDKRKIQMVDEKWEKYLETSNDMLGEIIDNMIDRSKDKGHK